MKFRSTAFAIPPRSLHRIALLSICVLWSAYGHGQESDSTEAASESVMKSTQGVAVVELFTSQGCSSCPPADAVLRQIASAARSKSQPVYALSFHVDYWNRLGWTDPYSDAGYTLRQRQYARAVGSTRVYTPQMIVNGTSEFNGSNSRKAKQAIADALDQPSEVTIAIEVQPNATGDVVSFNYQVDGLIDGRYLNAVVVSNPDKNKVPRGENSGRNLLHVNVVESFRSTRLKDTNGTVSLSLKDAADSDPDAESDAADSTDASSRHASLQNAQLIAFVQDPKTRRIVGATAIALD